MSCDWCGLELTKGSRDGVGRELAGPMQPPKRGKDLGIQVCGAVQLASSNARSYGGAELRPDQRLDQG